MVCVRARGLEGDGETAGKGLVLISRHVSPQNLPTLKEQKHQNDENPFEITLHSLTPSSTTSSRTETKGSDSETQDVVQVVKRIEQ